MSVGPGQQAVPSRETEPVVSQRRHLCLDLARLVVRGLCHRRVCPAHRRLTGEQLNAHRLRARCAGASLYARLPEASTRASATLITGHLNSVRINRRRRVEGKFLTVI